MKVLVGESHGADAATGVEFTTFAAPEQAPVAAGARLRARSAALAELLEYMRAVRASSGKRVRTQMREIARAKKLNPTLGVSDYFWLRLYDQGVREVSDARDFLGWRAEEAISRALNPRAACMPGWDKGTLLLLATDSGLPTPRLLARFMPGAPASRMAETSLASARELAEYLRTNRHWPLFCKPSYCQKGFGAYCFTAYVPETDRLAGPGGIDFRVDDFVWQVVEAKNRSYYRPEMGYLFQENLNSHPEIARRLGNPTATSVRVIVARVGARAELACAIWKIVARGNFIDHYRLGVTGNLVTNVDVRNGRVGRAMKGVWPTGEYVDRFPGSGETIEGTVLPRWGEVVALCERASALAPMMRIQHWDIAITDRGPVILELNDQGGIRSLQMLGEGLLHTPVREALAQHGDRANHPWIARLV